MAVEEITRRVIRSQPVSMKQEIVDVVGENELLDLHASFAKARDEIDRLREIDVTVVIAVNEKNGRLPRIHGSDGRGVMREFIQLG